MTENSILAELIFNPSEGALRFKDVRYLLIRPETIVSFQKSLEEEVGPKRAGEILYAGGFTGGKLSGRKYKETFGLSDYEAVEFMCKMGGEIGWGHFKLAELDPNAQQLAVEVHHSPFAEAYAALPSNLSLKGRGICHLIRGVLGGLGSGIFGVEVQAREMQCLACGDAYCRFDVEAD